MRSSRSLFAGFLIVLASAAQGGVVVHYSFDANFTDSSGNGNDGILFDTNTLGNAIITNAAAAFGAGGFTKGDDADRVDLTTPFSASTGTPWTVTFWATLSGGAISPGFSSTSSANYIVMRADVFNGVFLNIGGHGELFFPIVLGQNSFHHYAVVGHGAGQNLDGVAGDDNIVLYVDGSAIAPSNGLNTTTYLSDITIDTFGYAPTFPFGGHDKSDEFWIFDSALSSNRIANLVSQNSPNLLRYVNASATGANDGASWANALTNLQDAITSSLFGDTLWVAAGRYYPDEGTAYSNNDRTATFALFPQLKVYGGFAGTETILSQRNIASNLTVLSGDLDKNDTTNAAGVVVTDPSTATTGNNSYHVVRMVGTDGNSLLDGFTITSGRADDGVEDNGGGLFAAFGVAIAQNCTFSGNYAGYNGGGFFGSDVTMLISNCVLFANYGGRGAAGSWAGGTDARVLHSTVTSNICPSECGGLFIDGGHLRVEHTEFRGNQANSGGAVMQQGSAATVELINCLIAGNRADDNSGATLLRGGRAALVNCTFSGNSAGTYGAIRNDADQQTFIYNCVIWSNAQDLATNSGDSISSLGPTNAWVWNSIVQRSGGSTNWDASVGIDADGNEDQDPRFISGLSPNAAPSGNGNFRITYGSPAINSGYNAADLDGPLGTGTLTAATIDGDLDGAPRLIGTIDIGAYEFLDSDADRLSDWQEDNIYGSDAGDTDSDNDGMDDGDEAYAGTVLTNAASYLGLTGTKVSGTNGVIAWSSASNRTYRVWYSTNLPQGAWTTLGVFTSTPPQNIATGALGAQSVFYTIGVE